MMTNLHKITIKDISNVLQVSNSTAQRIYKDIKLEYKIKIVTKYHFQKYLKV